MNILPLIFTFLVVLSLIALTFTKEIKSTRLIEKAANSYHRVERNMNNYEIKKSYKKFLKEPSGKIAAGTKKNGFRRYISRRQIFPPLENSKFNLFPLTQLEGEITLHPLYELAASVLRSFYGNNLFKDREKKIEYHLLDAILANLKNNPQEQNLAELCPDDPVLAALYYQMLKGTNQYSDEAGISPLKDVLTSSKDPRVLSISFASYGILKALFDEGIARKILSEEKKKSEESHRYCMIPKEDLQMLLKNNPSLLAKFAELQPYIDFSLKIRAKKEIGAKDTKTGLSLRTEKK